MLYGLAARGITGQGIEKFETPPYDTDAGISTGVKKGEWFNQGQPLPLLHRLHIFFYFTLLNKQTTNRQTSKKDTALMNKICQ